MLFSVITVGDGTTPVYRLAPRPVRWGLTPRCRNDRRRNAHPEEGKRTYDTYAGCSAYRLARLTLVAERHSVELPASVLE